MVTTTGVVKYYNLARGFGFVARDDGQGDCFLGGHALERSGVPPPSVGDRLTFDVDTSGDKLPRACNIRTTSGRSDPPEVPAWLDAWRAAKRQAT